MTKKVRMKLSRNNSESMRFLLKNKDKKKKKKNKDSRGSK